MDWATPRRLLYCAALVLVTPSAAAQHVGTAAFLRPDEPTQRVLAAVSWNPSLSVELGYARILPLCSSCAPRNLLLMGELSVPVFLAPELDTGMLRATAAVFPFDGKWNVRSAAQLRVQTFDNGVSSGTGFGWAIDAMPGWFGDRWFGGLGLQFHQTALTYLAHHASYQRNFPAAKNGWYRTTAAYFDFSLVGGVKATRRFELQLTAGRRFPWNFEDYQPYLFPWVFALATSYGF